jgi:hypothetical protein
MRRFNALLFARAPLDRHASPTVSAHAERLVTGGARRRFGHELIRGGAPPHAAVPGAAGA